MSSTLQKNGTKSYPQLNSGQWTSEKNEIERVVSIVSSIVGDSSGVIKIVKRMRHIDIHTKLSNDDVHVHDLHTAFKDDSLEPIFVDQGLVIIKLRRPYTWAWYERWSLLRNLPLEYWTVYLLVTSMIIVWIWIHLESTIVAWISTMKTYSVSS